jgi:hypothetical protein
MRSFPTLLWLKLGLRHTAFFEAFAVMKDHVPFAFTKHHLARLRVSNSKSEDPTSDVESGNRRSFGPAEEPIDAFRTRHGLCFRW